MIVSKKSTIMISIKNKLLKMYVKLRAVLYGNREVDVFNDLNHQINSISKINNFEKYKLFEDELKKETEIVRLNIDQSTLDIKIKINLNEMVDVIESDTLKIFNRHKQILVRTEKFFSEKRDLIMSG